MKLQTFRNTEEFYQDNPERRHSEEADYGVHWRLDGWEGSFRVSYVRATGEVYAVHQGPYRGGVLPTGETLVSTGSGDGPLLILGTFPVDDTPTRSDVFYRGLEAHLEGWPQRCREPNGLAWVAERMLEATNEVDVMEHQEKQTPMGQPPTPRELLEEHLQPNTWMVAVRDEQDSLVVEVSRWSPPILRQIPNTWDGREVRVELKSGGKPGHPDHRRKGGTQP